ncbi:MAG: PH domain-containing protein [Balneolaceae bacterium]
MIELPSTKIDEKAIKAWRITSVLKGLPLFIIPGFLYFVYVMGDMPAIVPIITAPITLIIYVLIVSLFPKVRWSRWSYDVTEQGVDMHRGIIIRKRTMVPMNRIQHVDTKQGPIYRKFGLSSISISTAATTHEIPALDDETAAHLRSLISELVRKVQEDV